jgi:hypothetical protein
MAGISELFGGAISRDYTGWLATQWCTHPALPVFPANREFNREISQILGFATPETASSCGNTAVWTPIPYSAKQGIMRAEQGTFSVRTGNFAGQIRPAQA